MTQAFRSYVIRDFEAWKQRQREFYAQLEDRDEGLIAESLKALDGLTKTVAESGLIQMHSKGK